MPPRLVLWPHSFASYHTSESHSAWGPSVLECGQEPAVPLSVHGAE